MSDQLQFRQPSRHASRADFLGPSTRQQDAAFKKAMCREGHKLRAPQVADPHEARTLTITRPVAHVATMSSIAMF